MSFQNPPIEQETSISNQFELAIKLTNEEKYEEAIPLLNLSLKAYEQAKYWEKYLLASDKINRCYFNLYLPDEGIIFFEKAIGNVQIEKDSILLKGHLLLYLADNYYLKGNYKKAIDVYEKGVQFGEKLNNNELLLRYYGNLGWLYWDSGNHRKALEFQLKSLRVAKVRKDSANIAVLLRDIGDNYRTMNDTQSLDYFRQSLAIDSQSPQTYIQYSKAYFQFDFLDSALMVLKAGMHSFIGSSEKADAFYQFARIYQDKENFNEAISYIQLACNHAKSGYGPRHPEYARMTHLAGKIYLAAGQPDKALSYFHQTLQNQSDGNDDQTVKDLPFLESLTPSSYWVLGSLEGKGEAFYQKGGMEHLRLAMRAFELGLDYGENMRLSYGDESSKLELYEYLQPVVEGGVKTALALAELTGDSTYFIKAFAFAERAKAPVMAEALYNQQIKHIAGIPDSVLELEKSLQEEVAAWEMEIHYDNDPVLKKAYADSLSDARFRLSGLKDRLERSFPRYFELKYAFKKEVDLKEVQQQLGSGDLLVEYLIGKSALYTFAVSRHQLQVWASPQDDSLGMALAQFRRSVSDWKYVQDSAAVAEQAFLASASTLNQRLLALPLATGKYERLIVVPDGQLGLVPFEAMLTKPHDGSWKDLDMPYLVKDYAVSYAWSASSLLKQEKKEKAGGSFAGYGTEYDEATLALMNQNLPAEEDPTLLAVRSRGGLSNLPFADDEVKAVGKILKGRSWLNGEATKANFIAAAPAAGVLHLATHGILDPDDPMLSRLVFNVPTQGNDNQLFASELYNMDLQAELTVLSACNSGTGKVWLGEGTMSLARAFAFAGCGSLVTSLWSISDQPTSQLMAHFYDALHEGKAKNESLREAKLKYLESASSEYSKPIYWAGFVMVGDTAALPPSFFKASYLPYLIGATALCLALFLLVYFKRKQKIGS